MILIMKPIIIVDAIEKTEETAAKATAIAFPTPELMVSVNSPIFDFQSIEDSVFIISSGTISKVASFFMSLSVAAGILSISNFTHSAICGATRQITRVIIPARVITAPARHRGLRALITDFLVDFGKKCLS